MLSRIKIHLPSAFALSVILYLFWAWWKELQFSEALYNIGVFGFFLYMAITIFDQKWPIHLGHEILCMSVWCVFMFLAYNNSDYSSVQRTVKLFGIEMDSHARIMVYLFLVIVPGSLLFQCYKYRSGWFFKLIVLAIVITSTYFSIRAVIVFPDALRARATAAYLGHENILYGTPTYSIVYSLCLLVPWFLARTSETNGASKAFYLLISVCICIIVAISQFATALIALLLGLATYWLFSSKNDKGYIIRMVVVLIVVLIFLARAPLVDLFNTLSNKVSGAWSGKLADIVDFIKGESLAGDIAARVRLYGDSWDAFLQNPFLGNLLGKEMRHVGGHSTMLDVLAMTGLCGALLFVGAIVASYKHMKGLSSDAKYIAVINASIVSFVFLLCTKNIISSLSVNYTYFALLPTLLAMKENDEVEQVEITAKENDSLIEIECEGKENEWNNV